MTLEEVVRHIRDGKQPPLTFGYDSPETAVLMAAFSEQTKLRQNNSALRKVLETYANPFFYEELPPSRALEDKGNLARIALAETSEDGMP